MKMNKIELTQEKTIVLNNLNKLRTLYQKEKEHIEQEYIFSTILLYLERALQATTAVIAIKKLEETNTILNSPEEMFQWIAAKEGVTKKQIDEFKQIVEQVQNSIHDQGNDKRAIQEILKEDQIQVFEKIIESI